MIDARTTVPRRVPMLHTSGVYLPFLVLLFPIGLLVFMLMMERYERPLSQMSPDRDVARFLDHANAEQIGAMVDNDAERQTGRAGLPPRQGD